MAQNKDTSINPSNQDPNGTTPADSETSPQNATYQPASDQAATDQAARRKRDEKRSSHNYGHKLIESMGDLQETLRKIQHSDELDADLEGGNQLKAYWIDTNGAMLAPTIWYRFHRHMPFYDYTGIQAEASPVNIAACSYRAAKTLMDRLNSEGRAVLNAGDFVGRLAISMPRATFLPTRNEAPDFTNCENCMLLNVLERSHMLLTEPTRNRACPDCLALVHEGSGLVLPVPLGMTLEWRCNADNSWLDIRTYCLFDRPISSSAEYRDMTQDFDPAMLCAESTACERYFVDLLNAAEAQWNAGGAQAKLDATKLYERYLQLQREIQQIRKTYAR